MKPPDDFGLLLPEAARHYETTNEANRLFEGRGVLERARTRELLIRFLVPPPGVVLDVGGAAGVHAYWLASLGYTVHLIDAMPRHIALARAGSAEFPGARLASIELGDARSLHHPDGSANAVLLLGPLYHLIDRADRLAALREARRVLRPGGRLFAVGISKFASLLDGLWSELLDDPDFRPIVEQDLQNGQHRDPTDKGYFTTTFFHHPDELRAEVEEAGFTVHYLIGLDGLSFVVKDFDAWWDNPARRQHLMDFSRSIEREPSLLGLSPHIMAIALAS